MSFDEHTAAPTGRPLTPSETEQAISLLVEALRACEQVVTAAREAAEKMLAAEQMRRGQG